MIDLEKKLIKAANFMNPDLFTRDYDYIKKEVTELFSPTQLIEMKLGYMRVFRVRTIKDPNIDYSLNDFWIPPSDKVGIGRCNKEGEPVFYGALDPLTAIRELEIELGDFFLISSYGINAYTDPNIGKTVYFGIPKEVEHPNKNYVLATRIASNFAYNEFTREIDHVFNQKQYDSIIYPSVKRPSCFNIIVKADSAKHRLKLSDFFICKLIEDNDDTVTIEILKQGTNIQHKKGFEYDTHIHLTKLIGEEIISSLREISKNYVFF